MKEHKWLAVALAIYFAIAGSAYFAARAGAKSKDEALNRQRVEIAEGERDNALMLAKQYKTEYQAAVIEIADLKAANEELTAALKELQPEPTAWMPAGEFQIVHYCACVFCTGKNPGDSGYGVTATGAYATEGRTVAVDPSVIPLGSEVLINGQVYIAEDTGVIGNMIDVFVDDHDKAMAMGTYRAPIWWR